MKGNPVIVRKGRLGLLMTPRYVVGVGVGVIDLTIEDLFVSDLGYIYPIAGQGTGCVGVLQGDHHDLISSVGYTKELRVSPSGLLYQIDTSPGEEDTDLPQVSQHSLPPPSSTYVLSGADDGRLESLLAVVQAATEEADINRALRVNFITDGRLYTWFTIDDLIKTLQQNSENE